MIWEIHPAVTSWPAHMRSIASMAWIVGKIWSAGQHELAGSIVSDPAMMTCICQRDRKAAWSSRDGKLPTTDSNLRRIRNPGNPGNLCSLCNLCSHRIRARLPERRPEPPPCFPCRRRRTSPG
jgi:hypothetical protein